MTNLSRETLISAYKEHGGYKAAEFLGIKRSTFYRMLDKAGFKRDGVNRRTRTKKDFTQAELDKFCDVVFIQKMYTDDGVAGIMSFFDIGETAVRAQLKRLGVSIVRKKAVPFVEKANLIDLKRESTENILKNKEFMTDLYSSLNGKEISKLLEVSNSSVYRHLKFHGIKILDNKDSQLVHLNAEQLGIFREPDALLKMCEEKGVLKVAHELGITDVTIYNQLRRNGLKTTFTPSYVENELSDFLSSIGVQHERNRKDILPSGKELDIFIPSHNVAIEFNGLYWHSSQFKAATYHKEKSDECNAIGVRLIHIFEDEWEYRKKQVSEKLKSILDVDSRGRVFARKTDTSTIVDIGLIKSFYDENHIQGSTSQTKTFALMLDGSVVAMMSFKKRTDAEYELVRYATAKHVIGGFSKLFKYSTSHLGGVERVVSFADLRYSTGAMYENNGWILENTLSPDYQYVVGRKRIRKQHYRRKFLAEKLKHFDPNLSERSNTEANGVYRIYDCGLLKFSYELNRS